LERSKSISNRDEKSLRGGLQRIAGVGLRPVRCPSGQVPTNREQELSLEKYVLNYIEEDVLGKLDELWFHKAGRQQTSTGYGSRLVTPYKIFWNNRWRRVFCSIWSNCGTYYICCKKERWILRGDIDLGERLIMT
tara:strand:- start:334 stop:738 length:405 start_codon:yes stop_codon:yes gene_type:complete